MNDVTGSPCVLLVALAMVGCATTSNDAPPAKVSTGSKTSETADAMTPASGAIFVGCGYLVVDNQGSTHVTALVAGKEVRQAQRGKSVFVVDGVLIETAAATAREIGSPSARGLPLLRDYMAWEAAYAARENGWAPLRPDGEQVPSGIDGVDAFMWGYDFPSPIIVQGQSVVRVAYLTAAIDDLIFVASAPAREDDDLHVIWQCLGRVVRTVRRSPVPIDIFKLSAELKASREPWRGCPAGS